MARDKKYGHVDLEHGHVGDREPVVVFRGQDQLLPHLLELYWNLCEDAGSPMHHLTLISERINEIKAWQYCHADLVRVPRSDGYHQAH
jgi:hypothetical protein